MKKFTIAVMSMVVLLFLSTFSFGRCGGRYTGIGKGSMAYSTAKSLTEKDKIGLEHMVEEEKLAYDVYSFLYNKWEMPVFKKIARSESKHISAIERLISLYSLKNPVIDKKQGEFESTKVKKLYNKLIKFGSKSKVDALKVGATIEDLDIYDLGKYIKETNNIQIKKVYSNLMRGSRNHLRIFISALRELGGSYKPHYISKSLFESIISSSVEKGNRRKKGQF